MKEVAKGDAYATYWAAVQGDTDRVISDIIKELLGHQTTSPARAELKIHEIPDPHFWARQEVEYRLHPFPLISVKWTEYWSFNLLKGDVTHPEKVLITYEKASGTHYIRHLCGQYELTSEPKGLNGKKTRILIYEEASAKSRTEQETLSGIAASLRQLQKSSR
ncbi:MAG: hypothetical protein P4M08_02865 [Oligoflexia bacterium]|nr:hypothetical protein [Oligoflexia bacterium]